MRTLSIMSSLMLLGLCTGCATAMPDASAQNANPLSYGGARTACAGSNQQASLTPMGCDGGIQTDASSTYPSPSEMVVSNPNNHGPHVELWGPPPSDGWVGSGGH